MAAQEYFNMSAASQPQQSHPQAPAPRPPAVVNTSVQASPNPPYPMYDGPPPPYSPGGLRPDSVGLQNRPQSQGFGVPEKQNGHRLSQQAPSPALAPSRPNANGSINGHIARPSISQSQQEYESQFRPPVRQQHSYNYPSEKHSTYPPQGQPAYGSYQPHPQQYFSGPQPVQSPYQNGGPERKHNVSFAPGRPQQRYPSRTRSESRSRSRSRDRGSARGATQKKKSSGLNTFLGAGGGAILGDAIFPGLGTIGGALLGGFGGHEYDKNKKQRTRSHEPRTRERRYSDEHDHRPSRR